MSPDPTLSELIAARRCVWAKCGMNCRYSVLDPVRLMARAGDRPLSAVKLKCTKCGSVVRKLTHDRTTEWPVRSREILGEPPYERLLEL